MQSYLKELLTPLPGVADTEVIASLTQARMAAIRACRTVAARGRQEGDVSSAYRKS